MSSMSTRRSGRHGTGFVLSIAAAMLAGVAVGLAVPRPFESLRAAQPPGGAQQTAPVPLPFPGAQQPTTDEPADDATAADETETEAPPVATLTFEAPAAMVMSFVQAAGTSNFEQITRQLVEAMAASEDPERQGQAAGWTMYRVREPGPNNNTAYVWLLDPVVTAANYAAPQLLNEAFPEQVQQLYESFNQSFGVGQVVLNLDPVVLVQEPR